MGVSGSGGALGFREIGRLQNISSPRRAYAISDVLAKP